jgi:glycosyltransferase involved in cell wall biosynthesis
MLQEGVRTQDGIFRILSVGRFVPLKGFDLTIESFSYFVKTLPYEQAERCRLILVGTGPYKNSMRNMTVRLGVDHLVEWIPWTTRNELKKIYNNASVFCFPSHEGAGMVVAEALSAGLPVIALDNIGPGKFINEQCGTIVREKTRPATIQALAQAMIQLYNQPRVWRAKSARARKHYLTHFTWEVRRQQLRKLYQKALLPKVALVHMYNDYSGSPQVLKTLAEALKIKQYNLQLFTGRYQGGLLSGIKDVRYFNLPYAVGGNDVTKLIGQAWYQCRLFFKVLFARDLARTIVINTIWPAGAALAAWLRGRRVVYYLHEAVIRPAPLAWFLKKVAASTADAFVYVSEYLKENLPIRNGEGQVIYNTLLPEEREPVTYPVAANEFVVTMLCSLRGYKGVDQFVALAHRMPHIQFQLVLNASEKETDEWCQRQGLPSNIWVYPAQQDVRRFYHRSQMVLNLSLPERWVETFGMTILEGMSHGCVVIAPPAGGIQELFTDGKEGWFVNPHDAAALEERINSVYTDERLLIKMKACAKVRASHFRFANYTRHWDDLLSNQEEANIPVAF